MDGPDQNLDNSNMARVPTWLLYGESAGRSSGAESLHIESIAARSARHQWEIRPHRHAELLQILHLSGGSGEAQIEGARQPLTPPCIAVIPESIVHGFRFSRDVEGHVLTLRPDRLPALLASAPEVRRTLEQPRVLSLRDREEAARACSEQLAHLAQEHGAHGSGRAAALEAHLLALLVWVHRVAGGAAPEPTLDRAHRLAFAFRALIDAHYRRHRPLCFYAERLGVTPTHLNRVAQSVFGDSALGTIHRRLLLEARRELTFTVKPVAEVAEQLGFRDAAYFTRFFGRAEGIAPRAFRLRAAAGR